MRPYPKKPVAALQTFSTVVRCCSLHPQAGGGQLSSAQREWQRCRHWIAGAVARAPGFETIEDVERLIAEGRYVFFPGTRCAAVCEIAQYARRKVCIIVHGGGDLAELLEAMEPAISAFARATGCNSVMGLGRKGWERVTEKRGYRFAYIAMIKDLAN